MDQTVIKQLDQVQLVTSKNVTYLSAPPDQTITTDGIWSVAAILDKSDLLLTKHNITIRIPISDVLKIGELSLPPHLGKLGKYV